MKRKQSYKQVIAFLINNIPVDSPKWIEKWTEWIFEFQSQIGGFNQYKLDFENLQVSGYKAELPKNFLEMQQVSYKGMPVPSNSYSFPLSSLCGDCNIFEQQYDQWKPDKNFSLATFFATFQGQDLIERYVDEGYTETEAKSLITDWYNNTYDLTVQSNMPAQDVTYRINDGWFNFSLDTAKVCIYYLGISTDKEGFPMLPISGEYNEALLWFIIKRMMMSGWEHPNKDINMALAEQQFRFYRKNAYVDIEMPSVDEMETIKKRYLRLVPDHNEWNNFFTTGHRDVIL